MIILCLCDFTLPVIISAARIKSPKHACKASLSVRHIAFGGKGSKWGVMRSPKGRYPSMVLILIS